MPDHNLYGRLAARSRTSPLILLVVPVIWSLTAASAAVLLDVRADFMLLPAAVVLVAFTIAEQMARVHHQRVAHD